MITEEIEEARESLADSVPDSVRLKWVLRKLGEQESYVQELEHKIKELEHKERLYLTGNDDVKVMIKGEYMYSQQNKKIKLLESSLSSIRKDYDILLSKTICRNENNNMD